MFRPVEMSKVRLICLKTSAPSLIRFLHNRGIVHLKEFEVPQLERAAPLASYDEIAARLLRIRSLREALAKIGGSPPKRPRPIAQPIEEADELLAEQERLSSLLRQKEEILREIEAQNAKQRMLEDLAGFRVNFANLNADSINFVLLKSPKGKSNFIQSHLLKMQNCAFIEADAPTSKSSLFLIAVPKTQEIKPFDGLGQTIPVPSISSTPKQALSDVKQKLAELHEKLQLCQSKISRFCEVYYPRIVAVEEALSLEAERARVATMFGSSASLYYIEGWVEASKFQNLQSEIQKHFGKKALVSEATVGHEEIPPTKLSNPPQAGAFQFLVEFLSTTNYREIDPTMAIFITIPILYALIFGDAGYAVVSFFLASAIYKRAKKETLLSTLAKIWMVSAIPTFIIGVVFDEYFGFTHQHLLSVLGFGEVKLYEGFHRVSSLNSLLLLCIFVGMAHLAVGFLLGAINEWHHSKRHAIAKLSWIGIEISGFFLVAWLMFGAFAEFLMPAAALFAVSLAGLVAGEGAIAAVEIPSLASNIMSYVRIAAVGVGGLILAELINELLLPKLELSPMGILLFIITAALYLLLHLAACVLAMVESFIHGARLNVVEFFGKFYKGNGVKFSPFFARRVYSQEV